jgi:hypothetical protein
MAKQKGIISLVGTLGELNFYYRKGKPVARIAGGGFTAEAIKTKASMVRVRENSSEFGRCSKVKSGFRIALFPFLKFYKEGSLHGRMMQLFQGIKDCDVSSDRGSRTVGQGILTTAGKALLRDFEFTPTFKFERVLPMKGVYDDLTCTYSVTDFDLSTVRFPKGASHVELQFGVLGVDFDAAIYKLSLAAPMLIAKGAVLGSFSLQPSILPAVGLHRFAYLGITFYQEVGGIPCVLREEGSIGIVRVG